MSDTLFAFFERELLFLRQSAQEFAKQYPVAASRLLLEPNRSIDPHVERMVQAFALLAARIQVKLDDEFPELTEAMLHVLYPHYLAPIPSMAIVQFGVDPHRGPLPDGFSLPRHSRLKTPAVQEVPCRYRTAYPVTLWPVMVQQAQLLTPPFPPGFKPPPGTAAALQVRLESQSLKFSDLSLDRLRFFLSGEPYVVSGLYELIFNNAIQVAMRAGEGEVRAATFTMAPSESLFPVGFDADDALLPYPKRSFSGYRLLTEFFSFPQKFHFFDLGGFQRARRAGIGRKLDVIVYFNRNAPVLQQAVDAQTFKLGCTPVVNLFERHAEPIPILPTRYEYKVLPDVATPDGLEVYSILDVSSANPVTGRVTEYQPFFSIRHGATRETQQTFWYSTRRAATAEGDKGTDVYLNLVDLNSKPHAPAEATLAVRIACTNRDLPAQLLRFADNLEMDLEGAAPVTHIRCLGRPTLPQRPPQRRGAQWRLLSHLSLNHLSLSDTDEGREAFQEILRLYDFSNPNATDQHAAIIRNLIDGISSLSTRRVIGRVGPLGLCQGIEITITFDEQKYVGSGMYLFASVLERFLGLYASLNSFTQLVARNSQGVFKKWPPRSGSKPLI